MPGLRPAPARARRAAPRPCVRLASPKMKTRFAFVGFRHGHIIDLLTGVEERDDTEVVACCEEDAATREALAAKGRVKMTHTDFVTMLREVDCDVVAIGA